MKTTPSIKTKTALNTAMDLTNPYFNKSLVNSFQLNTKNSFKTLIQ